MRVLSAIIALAFVALGLLFGALNPQSVAIDLYALRFSLPIGVALLLAGLAGALLGGAAIALAVAWPLRRRLSRLERARDREPATQEGGTPA